MDVTSRPSRCKRPIYNTVDGTMAGSVVKNARSASLVPEPGLAITLFVVARLCNDDESII